MCLLNIGNARWFVQTHEPIVARNPRTFEAKIKDGLLHPICAFLCDHQVLNEYNQIVNG